MHRRNTTENALDLGRANLALFTAAIAAAAAAWIGLADAAGMGRVVALLGHVEPVWIAACFGAQLVAYAGYMLAVWDVARVEDGPRLSFGLTARTVVAGFGVYAAAHSAGGFAVDYWALRRFGLRRDQAIARVLGLGALEYAVLAPAALVCAMLALSGAAAHVRESMTLPWLAVIPGFAVALWISSPKRAARLAGWGRGGRLQRAFAHAVAGVTMLRALAARPRRHWPGVLGVALYWTADVACLWAALRVFGAELSLPALVLAYATGYVVSRRSLPLGGAGVVEVLMTFALVWAGLPITPALLGVLAYRLFTFWLPIVPALAVLPTVKELRRELREAEAL